MFQTLSFPDDTWPCSENSLRVYHGSYYLGLFILSFLLLTGNKPRLPDNWPRFENSRWNLFTVLLRLWLPDTWPCAEISLMVLPRVDLGFVILGFSLYRKLTKWPGVVNCLAVLPGLRCCRPLRQMKSMRSTLQPTFETDEVDGFHVVIK